jgi:addiction module RelE/StbE family toxin
VNREVIRTNAFVRALRRLLKKKPQRAADIESALTLLAASAFHPRLKTHKLKGSFAGVWACSAGYDVRILFEFVQQEGVEAIALLTAGSHDEVY